MNDTTKLTVIGHLEELRKRLWVIVVALLLIFGASFYYSDFILKFLLKPIEPNLGVTYFFSPTEAFMVKMKAAFLAAIILSSPILLSQIWLFFGPALYLHEKKIIFPIIFICIFLFVAGALFSFFTVIPAALQFFLNQQNEFLKPMISIGNYLDFLTTMLLAFGISFNLPVLILFLAWAGVLTPEMLQRYQRHAIILILIVSAAITPGPDIASQLFLAGPLFILFEISVVGTFFISNIKRKKIIL